MNARFLPQHDLFHGNYSIVKRDSSHEFVTDAHYHDFYEVQFYLSEADSEIIGTIDLNGTKHDLIQGRLILINMFTPHQINITTKEPYVRYCISFDSSLLLFACSEQSNLFNIFSNCAQMEYTQPLTPKQIRTFVEIYNRHENLQFNHGSDIMEKALILEVFANIYNIFYNGQDISPADTRNMAIITELINYIDAHLADDLSLEILAEHENFSTFHLSRMFKKYTGTTLNKYIVSKRIDKAKLLLQDPTYSESITDISAMVGFNNYTHFYRTFKAQTGLNPAEYKEKMFVPEPVN